MNRTLFPRMFLLVALSTIANIRMLDSTFLMQYQAHQEKIERLIQEWIPKLQRDGRFVCTQAGCSAV